MNVELRIEKKIHSGPSLIACIISVLYFFCILTSVAYSQDDKPPKVKRSKISLGRLINSQYSELSPIISPNGKYLFFTMGRDNPSNIGDEHLQDCYVSKLLPSKIWSAPKNLGIPINSKGNDAISGVSPDGRTLFIKNFNYNQTSGLCFARLDSNNRWNIAPITIQNFSNSNKLSSQCISVNGDYIIVSVERPDGFGKLDLYVSKVVDRAKNVYGPLQNLLIVINTKEDEFAPFLAADGKTLYFSSRGRGGYGEADVFMAKRLDDTWINWTAPKNLGTDINTPGMDAYYSIPASGTEAYFSSSNGENHLDLYKIPLYEEERPEPVMLLQGEVMNRNGDMIHAQIVATDLEDNLEISRSESSEGLGQFSLILSTGNKYRFSITAAGYLPFSSEIDLSSYTQFADTSITIVLDSVAIGSVATIEDIFFDFNQSTLKSESYYSLDKLAQLLISNPKWVVSIEGYTDSIGLDEFNKKLSLERAQTVIGYLITKGVSEKRLQAEGFGAANPVADNATEEGRRKNRRVEFRIIKFTDQ